MKTRSSTPRQDGFRMPAEFEKHRGCWMLFPERQDVWRLNTVPACQAFLKVIQAIARFEPVTVGVLPAQLATVRRWLPNHVRAVSIEYDDVWIRDTGPTCVVNSQGVVRGVDWEFNAWGGLFTSWDKDNQVARQVLEREELDRYKSSMILEGGAVYVDGEGTLIATAECILNPNRNANLDRRTAETIFKEYFNVVKVIWLPRGIYRDETMGHIDNYVALCDLGSRVGMDR